MKLPTYANLLALTIPLEGAITKVSCGWHFHSVVLISITASFESCFCAFSPKSCRHPRKSQLRVPIPFSVWVLTHTYTLHVCMTVYVCKVSVTCCFVGQGREPDICSLRSYWPGNCTLRDWHMFWFLVPQLSSASVATLHSKDTLAPEELRHAIRRLTTSAAVRAGNWLWCASWPVLYICERNQSRLSRSSFVFTDFNLPSKPRGVYKTSEKGKENSPLLTHPTSRPYHQTSQPSLKVQITCCSLNRNGEYPSEIHVWPIESNTIRRYVEIGVALLEDICHHGWELWGLIWSS
jgi:hypothetical protein